MRSIDRTQPDFLQRSRTFWQRRAGRTLTQEDARQNISGFFDFLQSWSRFGAEAGPRARRSAVAAETTGTVLRWADRAAQGGDGHSKAARAR